MPDKRNVDEFPAGERRWGTHCLGILPSAAGYLSELIRRLSVAIK